MKNVSSEAETQWKAGDKAWTVVAGIVVEVLMKKVEYEDTGGGIVAKGVGYEDRLWSPADRFRHTRREAEILAAELEIKGAEDGLRFWKRQLAGLTEEAAKEAAAACGRGPAA
jgi:hypothetical protein